MNQNTSVRGSYLSTSRLVTKQVHDTLTLSYFEKMDDLLMECARDGLQSIYRRQIGIMSVSICSIISSKTKVISYNILSRLAPPPASKATNDHSYQTNHNVRI